MTADAYAHCFDGHGRGSSDPLDSALSEIEVFLIYGDGKGGYKTFASESLKLTCLLYRSRNINATLLNFITLLSYTSELFWKDYGEPSETWD